MSAPRIVRAAAVQIAPDIERPEGTLEKVLAALDEAAGTAGQPGRIAIGIEADAAEVRLSVADTGRGTGCTLASAIAANLCRGLAPVDAAREAGDYVARALARGYRPGQASMVVLDHFSGF